MNDIFRKFATATSEIAGSAWVFFLAALVILAWALTGPLFGFSDTWQLVINTGTTIITFLMVFLIQNTQNRDTRAVHAKLDELIISKENADNHLALAEDMTDSELKGVVDHYHRKGEEAAHDSPNKTREEVQRA